MDEHRDLDKFIDESRDRQRNIVFPDTVRNARAVDVFLWRGSPDPPLVQRIAAWMFGLMFIFLGFAIFALATKVWDDNSWFGVVVTALMSLSCAGIGIRIFRNGFPRHERP